MTGPHSFWLERIAHRGRAAFNPDKSYQVFRNVKDFGAKGDGVTDDTQAIAYVPTTNLLAKKSAGSHFCSPSVAMASGNRCGGGDRESTT